MSAHLDAQLAAIAHPTRRAILQMTLRREYSAGELGSAFAVTRPAISQHVRVLVGVGLLNERRERQRRLYRVDAVAADALRRELDDFWARGLARLKAAAENASRSKQAARPRGVGGKRRSSGRARG